MQPDQFFRPKSGLFCGVEGRRDGRRSQTPQISGSIRRRHAKTVRVLQALVICVMHMAAIWQSRAIAVPPCSTFDSGQDGWTVIDRRPSPPNECVFLGTRSSTDWSSNEGNPSGCIFASDGSGSTFYWRASSAFVGDQSALCDQALCFDVKSNQLNNCSYIFSTPNLVVLTPVNGPVIAYNAPFGFAAVDPGEWHHWVVPLTQTCSGWYHPCDGTDLAPGELCSVLTNLGAMDLLGEYGDANDTGWLDNVCICQTDTCTDPPVGMVGWWSMDEITGPTAFDSTDYHNNGAHVNGFTPSPGKVRGGIFFTGPDDGGSHVSVPSAPSLDPGTGAFSIDLWARPDPVLGVTATGGMVQKFAPQPPNGAGTGYSYSLVGGISTLLLNVPGCPFTASSGHQAFEGWRHYAVTVSASSGGSRTVKFYVDGDLINQVISPKCPFNLSNDEPVLIGNDTSPLEAGSFQGMIDEVEIFDRVLSATEIEEIFEADCSGKCKCEAGPQNVFVNLTTGQAGTPQAPISILPGNPDDSWTVTCDASGGSVPRAPIVLGNPYGGTWADLPPGYWISANENGPSGDYCYETCFCLAEGFRNASLTFSILADDSATVSVVNDHDNNVLITTGSPGYTTPTGLTTIDQSLFRPGKNCIQVVVNNSPGPPTGFALVGQFTADNAKCCTCPLSSPDNGDVCESRQMTECVAGGPSGYACMPECVELIRGGPKPLHLNATQCACSDPGCCGPVSVSNPNQGEEVLSCEGSCSQSECQLAGGHCALFFDGVPFGPGSVLLSDISPDVDMVCCGCVPALQPIPTISEWGIAVMALLIVVAAVAVIVRRCGIQRSG